MFIYAIRQIGSDFYKIGISKSPEARLQALQTANPNTLELVASFNVGKLASQLETGIHITFQKHRVSGEWFNLTEEDVMELGSSLAVLSSKEICYQHRAVDCFWCRATGGDGYYKELPHAEPETALTAIVLQGVKGFITDSDPL